MKTVVKHVENVDIVDVAKLNKPCDTCDTCAWWTNTCQHPFILSPVKRDYCSYHETEEELNKELTKCNVISTFQKC